VSDKAIRDKSRPLLGEKRTQALARAIAASLNEAHVQPLGCTVLVMGHGVDIEVKATPKFQKNIHRSIATGQPMVWKAIYDD
jgi:hypothetical protein